ncbi:MAG: hypothetical protein IKN57_14770 [Parasporobacterium sp.]|nr:hypothetical protein [Parasporobacterium sp.]
MRIELEQPEDQKKASPSDTFIPPKDEKRTFRSEISKMKEMGFNEGLKYFIDYYSRITVVLILVIIAVISLTVTIIRNRRPFLIEVTLYNNVSELENASDLICDEFAEHMGVSLKDYQMLFSFTDYFDPSSNGQEMMATYYKFAAMVAGAELDIVGGNRIFMDSYGYATEEEAYFYDLSKVLPEDLFRQLDSAGKILYCKYTDADGKVLDKEYAAGINIEGTRLTEEAGLLVVPSYMCIMQNTTRLENAIEFIRWVCYLD